MMRKACYPANFDTLILGFEHLPDASRMFWSRVTNRFDSSCQWTKTRISRGFITEEESGEWDLEFDYFLRKIEISIPEGI